MQFNNIFCPKNNRRLSKKKSIKLFLQKLYYLFEIFYLNRKIHLIERSTSATNYFFFYVADWNVVDRFFISSSNDVYGIENSHMKQNR